LVHLSSLFAQVPQPLPHEAYRHFATHGRVCLAPEGFNLCVYRHDVETLVVDDQNIGEFALGYIFWHASLLGLALDAHPRLLMIEQRLYLAETDESRITISKGCEGLLALRLAIFAAIVYYLLL